MAIKSRMPSAGSIEKAIEALTDGLEIADGTSVEIGNPGSSDPSINELEDGSVEVTTDGSPLQPQLDQCLTWSKLCRWYFYW